MRIIIICWLLCVAFADITYIDKCMSLEGKDLTDTILKVNISAIHHPAGSTHCFYFHKCQNIHFDGNGYNIY